MRVHDPRVGIEREDQRQHREVHRRLEHPRAVAVLCGDRTEATLCELAVFHAVGWTEQIARVLAVFQRYPGARVTCDSTGLGDVITSRLQEESKRHRVEEYVFTRASKTQLVDGLADLFESNSIRMEPDPALLRELEHFEMQLDGKMEARRGYHDDMVMALGLAATLLPTRYRIKIHVAGRRKIPIKFSKKVKYEAQLV